MAMDNDPTPDRRSPPSGGATRRPVGRSDSPLSGEGKGRLILLCAGGTGGHLFPAEALAAALGKRGVAVELATDARAARHAGGFQASAIHVIPSATIRGRNPLSLARTGGMLGYGLLKAYWKLPRIKPAV